MVAVGTAPRCPNGSTLYGMLRCTLGVRVGSFTTQVVNVPRPRASAIASIATKSLHRGNLRGGPIVTFCTAINRKPSRHRPDCEIRHRPADWGVIPFPTLRGHDPIGDGSNGDQYRTTQIHCRARRSSSDMAARRVQNLDVSDRELAISWTRQVGALPMCSGSVR